MSFHAQSPTRPVSSAGRRTTSFGSLIKRTRSGELLSSSRRPSGERLGDQLARAQSPPAAPVPALPVLQQQASIPTFGGENYTPPLLEQGVRMNGNRTAGAPPVPAIPNQYTRSGLEHARTESMTHRSRYSYANSTTSALNNPRRVRRRKDPTPYNVLIIGAKNSGKTTFIEFLKESLMLPPRKQHVRGESDLVSPVRKYPGFVHHYQEIEVDNERLGLTLWDSMGLEKGIVDLQMKELMTFVESKFEETFAEEMKVMRSPGVRDTEIHVVFLLLDPIRLDMNLAAAEKPRNGDHGGPVSNVGGTTRVLGALDNDFDLQVLRSFQGKTTIVPVISKADTVTTKHMAYLKKMVHQGLREAGLDPLEALNIAEPSEDDVNEEDDEEADEDEADETTDQEPKSKGSVSGSSLDESADGETIKVNHKRTSALIRSASHKRQASGVSISSQMMDHGYVPMSILSPDPSHRTDPSQPIGRHFPWGYADPYKADHCDFTKLQEAVFSEWRNEIREANRAVFYERWRTNRLHRQKEMMKEREMHSQQQQQQQFRKSSSIPITLKPAKPTNQI